MPCAGAGQRTHLTKNLVCVYRAYIEVMHFNSFRRPYREAPLSRARGERTTHTATNIQVNKFTAPTIVFVHIPHRGRRASATVPFGSTQHTHSPHTHALGFQIKCFSCVPISNDRNKMRRQIDFFLRFFHFQFRDAVRLVDRCVDCCCANVFYSTFICRGGIHHSRCTLYTLHEQNWREWPTRT